jgi:hypothetical protein
VTMTVLVLGPLLEVDEVDEVVAERRVVDA